MRDSALWCILYSQRGCCFDKWIDYLPNVREVSPSNWVGISDRPGYGLSKCKWLGGSPSTRKRPGGGPAQGPNEARVMTGGGFIHLLVEKVTYWYLCLISKISCLCQGFLLSKFIGYCNSVYNFHNRGFQGVYEMYIYRCIYIGT